MPRGSRRRRLESSDVLSSIYYQKLRCIARPRLIEVNSPGTKCLGEYAVRRGGQRSPYRYANSLMLAEDGGWFHRDGQDRDLPEPPRGFSEAWCPLRISNVTAN